MAIHTGDPCFFCHEILQEDDDVVVCPDCGTPYHRACWDKKGACINLMLHESGESWTKEPSVPLPHICPNCGTENLVHSKYCTNCGASLDKPLQQPSWKKTAHSDTPNASDEAPKPQESFQERMWRMANMQDMEDPNCGMDVEEQLDGERLGDVSAFVEKNQIYYLPKFMRFRGSNHRISVNFPCLFFPQFYFAYRKMWGLALILIGVYALLDLPQMAMTLQEYLPTMIQTVSSTESGSTLATIYPNAGQLLQSMYDQLEVHAEWIDRMVVICNYIDICFTILFGFLGNWVYYRYVLRQVRKTRTEYAAESMRRVYLKKRGGTNGWLILGAVLLEYLITVILMSVLIVLLAL